ncbi:hypothetical protein RHGRI_007704 [Rhododendron griersonianum]|uniref:Aminotransferase-like plant mobile domain-containing protein n=1 Tax=Rhododendron griersonianum TaxID=479676 RepID=A0AAV6KYJ2_9ERIC|nr:hypothetical protein RHGRI_007704 [Rhododendron griersonianum]
MLTFFQVVFDPYRECRPVVADIAFYTGCICCMTVVEPYLPNRVLRQFGLVQFIPGPPLAPLRGSKGSTDALWQNWRDHLLHEDKRVPVRPGVPWESHHDYLPWFKTVSHLRVSPNRERYTKLPPIINLVKDNKDKNDGPQIRAPFEAETLIEFSDCLLTAMSPLVVIRIPPGNMASASSNATSGWERRPCACGSGQCIPTRAGLKSKYPDRYYYKCSRGNLSSAQNGKVGVTRIVTMSHVR